MAVCKYCDTYIVWEHDDEDDKWVPCDEYGERHDCRPTHPRQARETPAAAYERGYKDGNAAGFTAGLAAGQAAASQPKPTLAELFPGISATDLIRLTHPDLHPKEKAALANRITARLLELR